MKLLTPRQMAAADREAIEGRGIPSLELMERAGEGIFEELLAFMEERGLERVVCLCGKGNNGGDGAVIARLSFEAELETYVLLTSVPEDLSPDHAHNFKRYAEMGGQWLKLDGENLTSVLEKLLDDKTVVVDALLGTGTQGPVEGFFAEIIEGVNDSGVMVLAVDCPSGTDMSTGAVPGAAIEADMTVTLGCPKVGHFILPAKGYCGPVTVHDIGIPEEIIENIECELELIDEEMVREIYAPRDLESHKGDYGRGLLLAGSHGMFGACVLAARALMRSGAGMGMAICPESCLSELAPRLLETMTRPVDDMGSGRLHPGMLDEEGFTEAVEWSDAALLGSGISKSYDTFDFTMRFVELYEKPLAIDADAVRMLNGHLDLLKARKIPAVLLPHPHELAEFLGTSVEEIQADRIRLARIAARESDSVVLLKGNDTIIAAPDGPVLVNPTGNPGMATAGSGDVLAGIVTALLARGSDPLLAGAAGAYLHGLAGDIAAELVGEESLIASDIIEALPDALHSIIGGN
jgi:NAD(P)H-hydrate epimerase